MSSPLPGTATKALTGSSVFLAPDTQQAPGLITQLLDKPGQISNIIASQAENSIAIKIFGKQDKINAGVGFFSKINAEDLRAEGVKERAEGAEYAMVRITPPDLKRLDTSDIGGKFRVTDEAIENGVMDIVREGLSMISNSIVDILDDMVFAALKQSVQESGEFFHGNAWALTDLGGATPTPARSTAAADLISAQARLATNGMRANGSLLILHPDDQANLKIAYGAGYADLLEGLGITVATSPKAPAGEAYLLDAAGLGGVTSKNGLVSETWRDNAIRSTWVQSYLEPAVYISRPSNVVNISDIGRTE